MNTQYNKIKTYFVQLLTYLKKINDDTTSTFPLFEDLKKKIKGITNINTISKNINSNTYYNHSNLTKPYKHKHTNLISTTNIVDIINNLLKIEDTLIIKYDNTINSILDTFKNIQSSIFDINNIIITLNNINLKILDITKISINSLFENYINFKHEYDKIKQLYDKQKKLINDINLLIKNNDAQVDTYELVFSSNKNPENSVLKNIKKNVLIKNKIKSLF
jgi:hypothetical protein